MIKEETLSINIVKSLLISGYFDRAKPVNEPEQSGGEFALQTWQSE